MLQDALKEKVSKPSAVVKYYSDNYTDLQARITQDNHGKRSCI